MKNLLLVNNSKHRMPKAQIRRTTEDCFKLILKGVGKFPELGRNPKALRLRLKDQLVVVFLDAPAAKKINHQFRNKNYPTDILSFQSGSGLGELLICPKVLQVQAKEQGHSFEKELIYMLIHGLLHLLGFDHEQGVQKAQRMMKFQDKIFQSIIDKKSRRP